jgi:hypothetical protein
MAHFQNKLFAYRSQNREKNLLNLKILNICKVLVLISVNDNS